MTLRESQVQALIEAASAHDAAARRAGYDGSDPGFRRAESVWVGVLRNSTPEEKAEFERRTGTIIQP